MPDFERHGVYHIATRGGHEVTIVVIDDGQDYVEGFACDVYDYPTDRSPATKPKKHNGKVVVADESITVDPDAIDLTTYFGRLTDDTAFVEVDFPDVDDDPDTRYVNLADSFGYAPDVGDRDTDPDDLPDGYNMVEDDDTEAGDS